MSDLRQLALEAPISDYWDVAYQEGKTGVSRDNKAQEILSKIKANLAAKVKPVGHFFQDRYGYLQQTDEPTFMTVQLFAAPQQTETPAVWISMDERLPPIETPVLVIFRGECRVLERATETPGYEDTHRTFNYWDDPTDPGSEIDDADVTHWIPLPAAPRSAA